MYIENELMMKEDILKLNLPDELINYLSSSERIADKLYVSVLKDIEDLYLLYSNIYNFKSSQFCTASIIAIEKVNKLETFHYFLKRILEDNVEVTEKNTATLDNNSEDYEYIKIKTVKFEKVSKEAEEIFIDLVDKMYKKEAIELSKVLESFGKMEVLLELSFNEYHKKLLEAGRRVMNQYLADTANLINEQAEEVKEVEEQVKNILLDK